MADVCTPEYLGWSYASAADVLKTMGQFPKPSSRAVAIADGLVRTGRAVRCRTGAGFIRADGAGETYWISTDGTRLLRGEVIKDAEELQPGFLDAMARAGA